MSLDSNRFRVVVCRCHIPFQKIAKMKRKTAIFQVQGAGGKWDAKNKKIAGKIAKSEPHTNGTKVAKKGVQQEVTEKAEPGGSKPFTDRNHE